MRGLERAAARIGAARADLIAAIVAAEIEAISGVSATREGKEVTIAGRGLRRRLVDEPLLRAIGMLARIGR